MRAAILLVPFAADIALKILARTNPDALGRFSFSPSVGTIGLAPSINDVLAFSLPVPNQYIWPVGWIIVAILIGALLRSCKSRRFGRDPDTESSGLQACPGRSVGAASCKPIAAILLGAFSNLTDRTFLGGVTDYLSLTNLFPAFNIADLLIIGGIIRWTRSAKKR